MGVVWKCLAGAGLLLVGVWLLGVVVRLFLMARVMREERRIDKEGVDGFARQTGVGMDVHQKGPSGEGCARIKVEWTHPEKGTMTLRADLASLAVILERITEPDLRHLAVVVDVDAADDEDLDRRPPPVRIRHRYVARGLVRPEVSDERTVPDSLHA